MLVMVKYLIADDPEYFAAQIISVLESEEIKVLLQMNARRLSETYDWNTIINKQEMIYDDIIKKRGIYEEVCVFR